MERNEIPTTTPFPRVIKALGEGANLTANKAYLMLLPIILDLLLLFGPKLRISEYFQPAFDTAYIQIGGSVSTSMAVQMEPTFELMQEFLDSVNLLGFIQTFPIGVSLINSAGSDVSPLGATASVQLNSILQIIPIILAMIVLGVLIGTFYFTIIANAASKEPKKVTPENLGKHLLNTILIYFALVILGVILSVPCVCMMTVSMLTAPMLYRIFMLLMIVAASWLIIPLFYIPHAVFMKDMNLPEAVSESFKMASWSGVSTVRFILFSILITFGMNMIWAIPDQSSWLILFSIFGHAFVSTALLAGSFILYRDLDEWQKENRAFLEWRKANLRIKRIINKKEPEQHD